MEFGIKYLLITLIPLLSSAAFAVEPNHAYVGHFVRGNLACAYDAGSKPTVISCYDELMSHCTFRQDWQPLEGNCESRWQAFKRSFSKPTDYGSRFEENEKLTFRTANLLCRFENFTRTGPIRCFDEQAHSCRFSADWTLLEGKCEIH